MVLKPTNLRSRRTIIIRNLILFLVCMATSYIAMRFIIGQTLTEFIGQNVIPAVTGEKHPPFIDMQDAVNIFARSQSGQVSVIIYDIENDRYSAIYNSDAPMNTASVYKLFPVYENYLRMESGEYQKSETYLKTTKDGKEVAYTREQCAELALRESNSACAEKMVEEIGQAELDQIGWEKYDLLNTKGLSSTASDITKMLKTYYAHTGLSDETWHKIQDALLNQPNTKSEEDEKVENNWRQGLPSGFHTAKVYNKVGWLGDKNKWKIYNDAAIIEFPKQDRHYIAVVLTTNTDPSAIANLGNHIEQAVIAGSNNK